MKRLAGWIMILALPFVLTTVACGLSAPAPTSTPVQVAPSLPGPVIGLQPVSGPANSIVMVSAAGFQAGAKVNLFVSVNNATAQAASNLAVDPTGVLVFPYTLPAQIGTQTISSPATVTFHLETVDKLAHADALFAITSGTGPTATATDDTGSGGTDNSTGTLYITAPQIGAALSGTTITVTGSGSAYNNTVGVQVLDSANNIIGSGYATIQAQRGAVGIWQTTITFAPPPSGGIGYIAAYTVTSAGAVANRTSINVSFGPGTAATVIPLASPTSGLLFPATATPIIVTSAPSQ